MCTKTEGSMGDWIITDCQNPSCPTSGSNPDNK